MSITYGITNEEIRRIRIQKSGLITPFASVEECVSALFGIQSQAQQFGEISLLNRLNELDENALQLLYNNHQLIKIWGQRMTVHMYTFNDWRVVHQVYAHRNNFVKRGWADKTPGLQQILTEINDFTLKGRVTKQELADFIESRIAHIQDPFRDYSIFLQACLDGIIFGIPQKPQTTTYVHRSVYLNDEEFSTWQINKEQALEYLLLNYFNNYGPATIADFCHWSGLTQQELKTAFNTIAESLHPIIYNKNTYYLHRNDPALETIGITDTNKVVKLLGKFDPLFVSFKDKTWIADAAQQKAIWRPAAHIEAVLLVDDAVLGTWRYVIKGKNMDFRISLFSNISVKVKKKVEKEAEKIAGYLSKKVNSITYTTI